MTRRKALFGVAALGTASVMPAKANHIDTELVALGRQLLRLRRRCRRFGRVQGESPMAWSRWSRERERLDELCERIAKSPVEGLAGLTAKFEALVGELSDDDIMLELGTRRRLRVFGRDLRALAKL